MTVCIPQFSFPMLTTMVESHHHPRHRRHRCTEAFNITTPISSRVCFSYAAYAKNLVRHLGHSNIPVESGLSDAEFSAVEFSLNFTFPPDLRSILQEGLPVGPGFPNWRTSSDQQLQILINLPIRRICKEVSRNGFWMESWGNKPENADHALKLAEVCLKTAPVLVPIYRNFYIPSAPCAAGNPVFQVHGGCVRVWSFDIGGFFQQDELFGVTAPAWVATEARWIEFWSEVAAGQENEATRGGTRGWCSGELRGWLEEACRRLRDGGWKEDDVREMMMMNGRDEFGSDEPLDDRHVEWTVTVTGLSEKLLRAGWCREDVVESLGYPQDCRRKVKDGEDCFDFSL